MTYTWHPSRDYLDHSNVARLMRTLGVATADELRAREEAQLPLTQKALRADHVIVNVGTLDDLDPQVETLMRFWGYGS